MITRERIGVGALILGMAAIIAGLAIGIDSRFIPLIIGGLIALGLDAIALVVSLRRVRTMR